MALSPGMPTSFVPKQPVPVTRRPMRSSNNLFLMVSLAIAGIALLAAVGVFAYNKYLQHQLVSRQQQLVAAQKQVDENTVEDFVRLRDRLSSGKDLLTNHVVLSQFFDDLESLTLQNVRFDDLQLVVAGDHSATITLKGTAKNFNALAAQSNAFAADKRIKRAIFSDITLDDKDMVTFSLTADLDPSLVIQGDSLTPAQQSGATAAAPSTESIPASTSTAATTTSSL